MTTKKLIPGASPETAALFEFMKPHPVGTVLTYDELSTEIRKDVRNGARGYLTSACRRLLNQEGQVWECVRGTGMKRLADVEILDSCERQVGMVHRRLGRVRKKASLVQYEDLSEEDRRRHNAVAVVSETARKLVGKHGMNLLREKLPIANNEQLPKPERVLELFK